MFCFEAVVSQLTSSPPNPSTANETSELTLLWNYSIDGSINFARFLHIAGGESGEQIARTVSGSVVVDAKYQDRFRANISESQAWLKILSVQRSDEGKYQFELDPTMGSRVFNELVLIVQCKYMPWVIQM